jgi:lipopolysaccharide export system permease protein
MIRRLDRHVLTRFLAAFAFVTIVCVLLFVLFDLSLRAASFVRQGFTALRILQFYLYYVPEVLVLLVPMIVTLAVAWSIGRLARDNEVTAMRASGISPARIAGPLFAACAVLAVGVFVLNERVVTKASAYIREESLLLYRKPPKEVLDPQYFYTDDKRGKLHFERYHVADKVMEDVSWSRRPTADSPGLHVFADEARWLGGQWWLLGNVQVVRIDRLGNEQPWPACNKRIMYGWKLPPEYITGQKGPREMTIGELNLAIRRDRETQPERAREYRLERHLKLVLPILTLLMLPLSFAFVVKLGGGRHRAAAALGVSLGLCFAYYVFYILMVTVVRKWVPFPPIVWLPNVAYGTAATVTFLKMG